MTAFMLRHLFVLLLMTPLSAVQAQQQNDDTASTEQPPASDASAGQVPDDTDTDSVADLPDIDSQPIDGSQNAGPGRFIPSEQISQDFGVSFPVDI